MNRNDVYTFYSLQKEAFQLCHKLVCFVSHPTREKLRWTTVHCLCLCRAWTDTLAQLQRAQESKAVLICVPVTLHQRLFASWYLFICVCCASVKCLLHKWHAQETSRTSAKSAEKKTKNVWLPIAHYKQKPAAFPIYGRSTGASLALTTMYLHQNMWSYCKTFLLLLRRVRLRTG